MYQESHADELHQANKNLKNIAPLFLLLGSLARLCFHASDDSLSIAELIALYSSLQVFNLLRQSHRAVQSNKQSSEVKILSPSNTKLIVTVLI